MEKSRNVNNVIILMGLQKRIFIFPYFLNVSDTDDFALKCDSLIIWHTTSVCVEYKNLQM